MTPQLQALKAALDRFDDPQLWGKARDAACAELHSAATAAGFNHAKAVENWARYQVAVGESEEQLAGLVEAKPVSGELFG